MQDELALLQRARSLDQDALAQIHDAYYDAIYRYLSFRVDNMQSVEDLTSEVFLRFLSALRDKSAPRNTIRGWLYGAASLVLKEYYRRQKKAQLAPLDERLPETGGSPLDLVNQAFQREEIVAAMNVLTDDQRQVIALRFGFEMSIRDVAETMQKSEGSVKMLQVRALSALAEILNSGEVAV